MTEAQNATIKEAVSQATSYRKTQDKAHKSAGKTINKRNKSITKDVTKVQKLTESIEGNERDLTKAQADERKAAKQIIAVDNLTRQFLNDLDDVETGKKQTITA